ncbi:RNA methyltransferase [bacterium DOLZORAL124_38_8]|nr:MAG: RNA methyltransferase [bacterium DOLZORAL124_38_8]
MRIVILENIRSLHNVGAIFRTADAAGWDKVILTGYTGCPPDRRIEKVSLGAENFLPWEHYENITEVLTTLKNDGFEVFALEQSDTSVNLLDSTWKQSLPNNFALVLGNEVEGVSAETMNFVSRHIEIPMFGQKTSLNVSVAAGIAFYELPKPC